MARISKRGKEQYYFEKFCQRFRLPSGAVVYGDKPDVVVTGTKNIGIEITNFYLEEGRNPASEQVQRGLRARSPLGVLAKAQPVAG